MIAAPISVFACESQPVVVEGLRSALEECGDFIFAGAAAPEEAIEAILAKAPDLTVVDHMDGPEAALALVEQISAAGSKTQVVLWVNSPDEVPAAAALEAGARGVLVKSRPLKTLLECLRVVARGHLWFESSPLEAVAIPGRMRRRPPRLTPRERQVVELVSRGFKNSEIARALAISPGTVKVHLMHVFEKTGARDRHELAVRCRKLLAAGDGAHPGEFD
ncbi:MAG TPA: response regulator transcription factor [Bryobacteraceae bacterium]|nr:response regulator transcription factor [Bryobacteraceae bacterium]HOL71976.1 response regulator transcription factor [Bryobacteraceae bacterium]HOQ44158.1 response regulator transcription factor [Bryobacteraceae bacterium]HPQ15669.1 response regulator transcription factor [Bryobacteraceae bacterium]HPU70476.1 response regulator transcription factor [Bryobacteraceae bacterium]